MCVKKNICVKKYKKYVFKKFSVNKILLLKVTPGIIYWKNQSCVH